MAFFFLAASAAVAETDREGLRWRFLGAFEAFPSSLRVLGGFKILLG